MSSDKRRTGDAGWIERVRDGWQAPPRGASQRVAFDERLDARLLRRSGTSWLLPIGALAAAAATAALIWSAPVAPPETSAAEALLVETVEVPTAGGELADAWMEFGYEAYAVESPDAMDSALPDDYAAIESLLLGS